MAPTADHQHQHQHQQHHGQVVEETHGPQNNDEAGNYHAPRHNPKELRTAESINEYMHTRQHAQEDSRQTDFKDVIEAQRDLKSRRRLSIFGGVGGVGG